MRGIGIAIMVVVVVVDEDDGDDDAAAADDDDAGVCRTPLTVGVFSEALIITTGDIFCRFCRSCF